MSSTDTAPEEPVQLLEPQSPKKANAGAGTAKVAVTTLVALLAVGEIVPRTDLVNRLILPTPTDTVQGLWQLISGGYWLADLRTTLYSVVIAWLIGCTAGFLLGTVMGVSPYIRQVVAPYAIAVQALPKIVLAPLLIGWLGFGAPSKIAIAVAICFFPVWVDTMIGLALPTADEFKLMQALRSSRWQLFKMLQLPTALPMVMVGFKHAMLLSFTGVLVAEILAASAGGLGTLAKAFALQINMPLTFAVIIVVIVIAVTLVSVLDYLEQKFVFWSEAAQQKARG